MSRGRLHVLVDGSAASYLRVSARDGVDSGPYLVNKRVGGRAVRRRGHRRLQEGQAVLGYWRRDGRDAWRIGQRRPDRFGARGGGDHLDGLAGTGREVLRQHVLRGDRRGGAAERLGRRKRADL